MVSGKVINISHWGHLRDIFNQKVGYPLLTIVAIQVIVYFFLFDTAADMIFGETIAKLTLVFLSIPIILHVFIFHSHFQFTRFEFSDTGMFFISPRRGLNRQTITYRIPYPTIRKIYLNLFSTYIISSQIGTRSRRGRPIRRISYFHFIIPLSVIKDKENERKIFKAFESLNHYYLDQPGVFIFYEPPTVYYSPMKDVQKLRGESGTLIFSVKQTPHQKGSARPGFIEVLGEIINALSKIFW